MQCLILAGGLGTRMYPLTKDVPKALLPIENRPFAAYQLGWLQSHGVTDVVYSVGFLGEMIESEVGDGARFGLRVRYVHEGTDLRGTGGAVRLAADRGALADRFLLIYGDSFLPIDVGAVWEAFLESRRPALMTIYENQGRFDTSNVGYKDGKLIYDKKRATDVAYTHIDYGLLAFTRELIESEIPSGERVDLSSVLHTVSVRGDLAAWESTERFFEIGSPDGLRDFGAWVRAHPEVAWPR